MKKLLVIMFILAMVLTGVNAHALFATPSTVVIRSDCSGIKRGGCLDSDDGKLYTWDGDSVELVAGSASTSVTVVADADTNPGVNDDIDSVVAATTPVVTGYSVGDNFINDTASPTQVYQCIVNTDGAAVWQELTGDGTFEPVDAAIVRSDEAETITANWVNTDNPWADNEVADGLTLGTLKLTELSSEPDEVVGQIYLADQTNWDPAGLGAVGPYYALCTVDGGAGAGTYKAIMDITGKMYLSSVEIPNETDPDVDAEGEISHDTDGANETSDEVLRGYDGAAQFAWGRKIHCIHATVIAPNDLADTERDCFPIWHNNTGMQFKITEIIGRSKTDDTEVNIEMVTATDWTTRTTLDALDIDTNGTGMFYDIETSFTHDEVEHDEMIALDFDDTDVPTIVQITICGWFNADID